MITHCLHFIQNIDAPVAHKNSHTNNPFTNKYIPYIYTDRAIENETEYERGSERRRLYVHRDNTDEKMSRVERAYFPGKIDLRGENGYW